MHRFTLFDPVLHLTIGRDVFHWTRTIQRHEGDDVLDTGRFHPLEGIHHARAFHLKHRDSLGAGVKLVTLLIIQRDRADIIDRASGWLIQFRAVRRDMQLATARCNLLHRVLNDREGFQTQKVELHQTRLFDPFHIELGCRHVRARVLIKRNKRVQRTVADHNTRRMGGSVP